MEENENVIILIQGVYIVLCRIPVKVLERFIQKKQFKS